MGHLCMQQLLDDGNFKIFIQTVCPSNFIEAFRKFDLNFVKYRDQLMLVIHLFFSEVCFETL